MNSQLSRRTFLKVAAAASGGLLIGAQLPLFGKDAGPPAAEPFAPNAWIRIGSDDQVTVLVGSSEMGQGAMTAVAMLAAEELDADWNRVRAEFAPVDKAYTNPLIGLQLTGGSTTVRAFWKPVREAGATARALLLAAAAQTWGVTADTCQTANGAVLHKPSGRRLSYGELAGKAAGLPVPEKVALKDPAEFKLLGKAVPRLDIPAKVNGSAVFGQDVQVPGLLVAVVARCPVFGGKVKKWDAGRAEQVKGVRKVLSIPSGVAVVAEGFWPARQGRDALVVEWDEGPLAGVNSVDIQQQLQAAVEQGKEGAVARQEGDVGQALKSAVKTLEAVYEVPYLAHACMEPMNCTAHVRADGCDIWVPTQSQTLARQTAAEITGLSPEKIRIHTTFLGGGFGRRAEQDFLAEAVQIAKAVGVPVKVLWTREDDMQHDFYRPVAYNRLSAGLDARGLPVAWSHRIAGPSILTRFNPQWIKNGIDNSAVEGAANLPYAIPNIAVTYARVDTGVPVGFWRSVGHSQNYFITECFLDELAAAGGQDPYELRRALLAAHPRHQRVLELAATRAGWGTPLPQGRARGIAVAECFGSVVAEVAEIALTDGQVRVHKVVCAVDCGTVANPNAVEAQMQSGIVFGLTAALYGEITIENGRVRQSNFHDYPLLRIDAMPEVQVHIVPSSEPPGGVGEPGTPPIAAAVANAVFAATGKPVRKLPIQLAEQKA
jgi:isoquinoline 1-oxidoreductase beta subunit